MKLEDFKDELIRIWAEILLEVLVDSKQIEDAQLEILDFFAEIFNKEAIKDFREEIFSFVNKFSYDYIYYVNSIVRVRDISREK